MSFLGEKKKVTSGGFLGHSKTIPILAFRLLSSYMAFDILAKKKMLPYAVLVNRCSLMGPSYCTKEQNIFQTRI